MATGAHFLAFDLGAESGRAMLGRLRAGVLDVSEIHRFVNEPVRQNGSLHWDVLRIWLEIKQGMERAAGTPIESVGVDAWGCDYALVGEQGVLLQNPYHYRDKRTDGIMEAVFERVAADEIYAVTGIQFLPFNTLYQLYAACRATPRLVDAATSFGTIPDLVNYWLTGEMTAEFTNATTTQFIDARTRSWATDLLQALDVPTRILPRSSSPERSSDRWASTRTLHSTARESWRQRATIPARRLPPSSPTAIARF
jgi:rhamnulokinase